MEYASLLIEQAMHVVHYMMQAKTGGECHVKWKKGRVLSKQGM